MAEMKNITDMKKKKKYTTEEIFKWLDGMLDELSVMMERCEEKDKIGFIYSLAYTEGGIEQITDDEAALVDTKCMSEWVGNKLVCLSALVCFQNKYKDMAKISSMVETFDPKKIFGI